jgi:hypothetical protein
MKGSGKYPNFYQICSAVSITNFVFILYYATPIVSVLLPIQSYLTPDALRWVFAASPIIAIQLIELPIFRRREMLRKRCC